MKPSAPPVPLAGGEHVVLLTGTDRSGAAIARRGETRLVVPGGIPGERVRVRQVHPLGRGVLAEIVAVEEASPHRIVPRCRHAAACGGCAWQHVAYTEQLRWKALAVERLLRRALGGQAPAVEPTIGMPVGEDGMPWGFRQKAAFVFGARPAGSGLVMGHFARGTNDVVPVEECPVHTGRANRIAFALRDALARAGVPAAGPAGEGLVRHVVVRTTADEREAVALLVATRDDASLEEPLRALLETPDRPEGLALNLHDRPGPWLLGRATRRFHGPGHIRETSLGPAFLVSPTSFFQTNVHAAGVLVRLVTAALPAREGLRVLDLYSGSGLFALEAARRGHTVTAVEASRKASRDAALNARQNGVGGDRLRLVCARAEDALRPLGRERFDAVILDPPREGCPAEVIRIVFGRLRPARAILVSCNPEALAREVSLALESGYRAASVQPVDMFPHTPHVEVVAVLTRDARGAGPTGPKPPRRGPGSARPTPRRSCGPTRREGR